MAVVGQPRERSSSRTAPSRRSSAYNRGSGSGWNTTSPAANGSTVVSTSSAPLALTPSADSARSGSRPRRQRSTPARSIAITVAPSVA
ncbi:MAG: hypothetical protein KA201_00385 [Kofleriaceae bacterium]|nr:hypothetical protein [Kofleriaceae bacterium]